MPTVIIDFFSFDIPRKPIQIDINIKPIGIMKDITLNLKQPETHEKLDKFYQTSPRDLQNLGRFLVTLPFPMPESFLPPCATVCRDRSMQPLCHLKV